MEELAGIVLLLIALSLTINLITGGKAGVQAKLRATFLGQTA